MFLLLQIDLKPVEIMLTQVQRCVILSDIISADPGGSVSCPPTYQLTQYLTRIWHGIYWIFAFHTKLWHPADFPSQEREQNSGNLQEIKYFPNLPNVPNANFSTAGWQYHLPASVRHNIFTAQIIYFSSFSKQFWMLCVKHIAWDKIQTNVIWCYVHICNLSTPNIVNMGHCYSTVHITQKALSNLNNKFKLGKDPGLREFWPNYKKLLF